MIHLVWFCHSVTVKVAHNDFLTGKLKRNMPNFIHIDIFIERVFAHSLERTVPSITLLPRWRCCNLLPVRAITTNGMQDVSPQMKLQSVRDRQIHQNILHSPDRHAVHQRRKQLRQVLKTNRSWWKEPLNLRIIAGSGFTPCCAEPNF